MMIITVTVTPPLLLLKYNTFTFILNKYPCHSTCDKIDTHKNKKYTRCYNNFRFVVLCTG